MGIKLWELIKWCSEGAYVEGDKFVNGHGEEMVYDGKELQGLENAQLHSIWFYWNNGYDGIDGQIV